MCVLKYTDCSIDTTNEYSLNIHCMSYKAMDAADGMVWPVLKKKIHTDLFSPVPECVAIRIFIKSLCMVEYNTI